jgi:pantetheine-phosphate adenylyltransferase
MNQAAMYAGTFDPITRGHLDVVERAARIFPRLLVAVAGSTHKRTLFDVGERVAIVREAVANVARVEVEAFEGLLVDYARARRIGVVVRGLRAFSDFEFELQMALTNRKMAPDIETLFLMPKEDFSYISSSIVCKIAALGGDVSGFVPPASLAALSRKLGASGPDRLRSRGTEAPGPGGVGG